VRVIAGTHGGRRLQAPRGTGTRPTSDRVREAVFAMLGDCTGAAVVDVFAGSGAMGIEALSRGARSATFIERDPDAVGCIRRNLATLGLERSGSVLARDWEAALATLGSGGVLFDICFIDPPYSLFAGISDQLESAIAPVLAEYATVMIEGPAKGPVPTLDGVRVIERTDRSYGSTRVSILRVHTPGATR
jgi:16S rRNA (guanine966-N2)-methyltransferase